MDGNPRVLGVVKQALTAAASSAKPISDLTKVMRYRAIAGLPEAALLVLGDDAHEFMPPPEGGPGPRPGGAE